MMFIAGVEAALRAIMVVAASGRCPTASAGRLIAAVAVLALGVQAQAIAQPIDPKAVRAAALAAGLESLANVPVPAVQNLYEFLQPGAKARRAAVRLGKALF